METYQELKKRQEQETNAFPFGFAFSTSQFKEMMEKWGLTVNDTDKIYSIGMGGYVQKKDSDAMHQMMARHKKELQDAIDADTAGDGFVKQMFLYELANHEFGYTGDLEETLDALNISSKDLEQHENLKSGLMLAISEVD